MSMNENLIFLTIDVSVIILMTSISVTDIANTTALLPTFKKKETLEVCENKEVIFFFPLIREFNSLNSKLELIFCLNSSPSLKFPLYYRKR